VRCHRRSEEKQLHALTVKPLFDPLIRPEPGCSGRNSGGASTPDRALACQPRRRVVAHSYTMFLLQWFTFQTGASRAALSAASSRWCSQALRGTREVVAEIDGATPSRVRTCAGPDAL